MSLNDNDDNQSMNFGDFRKELVFLEKLIEDIQVQFMADKELQKLDNDPVLATSEYIAMLAAGSIERIKYLKAQLSLYN